MAVPLQFAPASQLPFILVVIFYELVPASQLPFILMAILMGLLQLCLWLFL